MSLTIKIEAVDATTYEVQVAGNDNVVDIYTTTSPQRTVLKVLQEHNVKGKRGRKLGYRAADPVCPLVQSG